MIRRLALALTVTLTAAVAVPACVEHEPDSQPTEADWAVIHQNLLPSIPTMQHTVNATIGDRVVFLGTDVDQPSVQPGKPFVVTYYWKVNSAPDGNWKLFTHIGGPNNQGFINADHVPIYNKYPPSLWKAGDIIKDVQNVSVPSSWSYPVVNLYVGMWTSQDNRIPITADPNHANDGTNRVLAVSIPVSGKAEPKKLLVRKLAPGQKITLDGKLDEPAWALAQSTGPFVQSVTGQAADRKTEAKVLWDDQNLYLGYTVEDPDVSSDIKDHDGKIYTEDAVELMVDADGDSQTYEEFEVAPTGLTFDSYLPAYRQNQNDWESGMQAKVMVDGTLNNDSDTDKGYTVEVEIPLKAFAGRQTKPLALPPALGTVWRANLYWLDKNKAGQQNGFAWSPPMVPDFHALAQFGQLVFADASGQVPAAAPAAAAPASAPVAGAVVAPMMRVPPGPHPMMMPPHPIGMPLPPRGIPVPHVVPGSASPAALAPPQGR